MKHFLTSFCFGHNFENIEYFLTALLLLIYNIHALHIDAITAMAIMDNTNKMAIMVVMARLNCWLRIGSRKVSMQRTGKM